MSKTENKATSKIKVYSYFKRAMDILLSTLAIIILSPVLLIITILIKIESPKENAIFKQLRVGENGKLFNLYKFRSMKSDAPELSTFEFEDSSKYITKVGALLRKTSLDELPQLFCVFKGDMSLIGPRPLIQSETDAHELRNKYNVYSVKPGITGLAQINGRDDIAVYDKVMYDKKYVETYSFSTDISILLKTVLKVLKQDGIKD